jgi:hypothetical protein
MNYIGVNVSLFRLSIPMSKKLERMLTPLRAGQRHWRVRGSLQHGRVSTR